MIWLQVVASNNDNANKIDAFIRSNRRVSISDIVMFTGISRGSVHKVVRDNLQFRKVSARWVPRQLKPEQQAIRMITSLDNLQRYNDEGEAMLERIVTGDETWVHHYQLLLPTYSFYAGCYMFSFLFNFLWQQIVILTSGRTFQHPCDALNITDLMLFK